MRQPKLTGLRGATVQGLIERIHKEGAVRFNPVGERGGAIALTLQTVKGIETQDGENGELIFAVKKPQRKAA